MKAVGALLLLAALLPGPVQAADLQVLTAGAVKPLLQALATDFERETGHRLNLQTDTAGALTRRVLAGERFDAVIVTQAGLQQLAAAGQVDDASRRAVVRVGIGVAVKQDAARPDIGSVAAFTQALLNARAVALIDPAAGGSSGIYLAQLFQRLGIADEMQRKSVRVSGGLVATRLLNGEADLALQQITELMVVPGVSVVGPLPAEIQNDTVYAAGVAAASAQAGSARALIDRLTGAPARALLPAMGMLPP